MIDLNKSLMSQEYPHTNFWLYDLFDGQMFSNKTGCFTDCFLKNSKDDLAFYKNDIIGVHLNLEDGII